MQRSLYGAIISLISILSIASLYADESTGSVQVDSGVTNSGSTYTGTTDTGSMMDTGSTSTTGATDSGTIIVPTQSVRSLLSEPMTITSPSPTIHSIPGFGNWSDPSSWSEGRIPTTSDIVEINGIMNLDSSPTVAGIVVNVGGTLSGPYNTLSITGNFESNGTINTNIIFGGDIVVYGSVTIGGSLNFNNHSITIDSGKALTISGQITGTGNFIGDNISLNTYGNINRINITGTGLHVNIYGAYVALYDANIIAKYITIHSGTTVGNWFDPSTGWLQFRFNTTANTFHIESGAMVDINDTLKIYGNIVNDGKIYCGVSSLGQVNINGNIVNNGIWTVPITNIFGSGTIQVSGSKSIDSPITLNADISLPNSFTLGKGVNFNNHSITLDSGKALTISGQITGTGNFIGNNISLHTYGDIINANIIGSGLSMNIYKTSTIVYETNIHTQDITIHSGANIVNYYIPGYGIQQLRLSAIVDNFHIESGAMVDINDTLKIYGNIVNDGKIYCGTSSLAKIIIDGNVENNGVWIMPNTYISGSTIKQISGSKFIDSPITLNTDISVPNSFTLGKGVNFNNHSITLDSGKALTISGQITGTGNFIGDNISLNTYGDITNLNIIGSGLSMNIYGASTIVYETNIHTKDLTIHSGSNLVNWRHWYNGIMPFSLTAIVDTFHVESGANITNNYGFIKVYGDFSNKGKITGDSNIYTYGNIENNGTWTTPTYASWLPAAGAASYNIIFDPGTSTGFTTTATSYNITDKIAGSFYWQVTPNNSGPYDRKCINIVNCVTTGGTTSPLTQPIILPYLPSDISLGIYNASNLTAILTNQEKNINSTILTKDALDPVDLATGDFRYSNTLMHLAGDEMDYNLAVNYKSQVEYKGPLGHNWDHSYNKRLIENTGGSVTYTDGKLGKYTFIKNTDGSYEYMKGLNVALTKTASGTYQMEFKNGDIYTYNSDLRITSITNSQNKKLSFSYSSGNLAKVTDTLGRDIIYSYSGSGQLEGVTEPGGRQVNLTYFASGSTLGNEGDLQNIEIKNGIDEKNIGFTYSKNTDTKIAHNILTMTDSKGAIYVTNTYDSNDRVLTQKYGDYTGSYEYTTEDIHTDDTLTTIGTGTIIGNYVTKNRARDRSGNITDYTYNRMGNVLERTSAGLTTRYTYDEKGQLITETLPLGNGTSYTYDALGNKTTIRKKVNMQNPDASTDIVTTMTYTGVINTIDSIRDPLGNLTTFESDARGNITKIIKHATANTTESVESFVYNTNGHLIQKTDANGNITTYEYNQIGKPTRVTRGKGTESETSTTYTYDAYGNPKTEIDGRGNTRTLTYDAFDRLIGSLTSEGIRTRYLSDANNNKIKTTLELSASETVITDTVYNLLDKPTTLTADIDATRRASISYTYDADDRLLETTYPNGQKEKRTYDSLGRLTSKDIIGSTTRTTSYTYDNNSNVTSETVNGLTSTFSYDGYDHLISSTDANGTITTMSYDKNGNILESVVENQAETILKKITTEYDRDNRPTKITEYGDTNGGILTEGQKRIITRTYDNIGNVLSESLITDSGSLITTFTYDALNRVSTTTLPNGVKTENTYDKNSNVIQQQIISPDKTLTTTSTYDGDNRKISTTDASGNTTNYTYNKLNQIIEVIDPKGISTTYTYDYRGKVTREARAGKTITKTYDLMGNIVSLTDANGNITSYTYNGNNELTSEKLPDNSTTSYAYDSRGNVATKTDPNGTRVTYTYDNLNRIIRKDIARGTGVEGVTFETYAYDPLGRLLSSIDSTGKTISFTYDLLGNLVTETNGGKTIQYTYDTLGNKTSTITPNGKVIANTYDTLNRITAVKRDNVNVATYTYDSLNLIREVLGNGIETNYNYDAGNRMNQVGNEALSYDQNSNITQKGTDTYIYDQLNQITQSMYGNTRFGTGMQGNAYDYDLMGNRYNEQNIRLVTRTTKTGAIVTTEKRKIWNYEINSLNQYSDILAQSGTVTTPVSTGTTNTGATSTGETNTGNTSTGTTDSGSTSTGSIENGTGETNTGSTDTGSLISDTGSLAGRLLYDKNGNLIGNVLNLKREYEYTYDYNNRLVQVSRYNSVNLKEVLISYTYDTLGRRTSKKVANQLTEYIYSGNDVIEETLSTVNPTSGVKVKKELREYVYGSKGMDDIISVTITPYTRVNKVDVAGTSNVYYYEKDHLGSITKITSSTGGIVDEYSYTVFGKTYKKNDLGVYKPVSSLKSAINNTRLYTGREYDRETNLYYLRARYYDANLGRFISRDPIGMQDDINLYRYVGNNSVLYTDRNGKEKALFLKNNEGNAWYFAKPPVSYFGGITTPHAELYFIQGGKEYIISFGPEVFNLSVLGGDVKSGDISDEGYIVKYAERKEYLRSIAMNPDWWNDALNSIKIDAKYVDSSKLLDFYNTELNSISQPDYNLYINNCSAEVRKALKSAGFFDTYLQYDPLSTPNSLGKDITGELQYKSIKAGIQSLLQ